MTTNLPTYDDAGINLADPHDKRGYKTRYITQLQVEALRRLAPQPRGIAVDIGCGYGRMSGELLRLGYEHLIGIDPSARVLAVARELHPDIEFREGQLPDLPVPPGSVDTAFLLNVLRPLHLMGCFPVAAGASNVIRSGGYLVVLDNLRIGHPAYIPEEQIIQLFASSGLHLVSRTAIRGARWPWTILMQYGLVPQSWNPRLVDLELGLMRAYRGKPRFQYHNVVWVFGKP